MIYDAILRAPPSRRNPVAAAKVEAHG